MTATAVVASTGSIDHLGSAGDVADYLEARLDLLDPAVPLPELEVAGIPLIVSNRPTWAGGRAAADPDRVDPLIDAAGREGVWAVDVEYETLVGERPRDRRRVSELLETADDAGTKVVCSHHPSGDTDAGAITVDHLRDLAAAGDIGKLAVRIDRPADLGRLVAATVRALEIPVPVTTMAIGPYALTSRLVALAGGAPLVYGALDVDRPTATGQPAAGVLRRLRDALGSS